ncbi:hypothetical protein C0J52_06685 [Blattella germanica]|nr:hypothetical protein C0J52_06685 [Blattella germanica]
MINVPSKSNQCLEESGVFDLRKQPIMAHEARTCEDLRCLRTEVCVMEQGPCDYIGRCPRNPTCRISKRSSSGTCETVKCPRGQFCSMIEDRCLWRPCPSRPTCVSTNSTGLREVYTRRPTW